MDSPYDLSLEARVARLERRPFGPDGSPLVVERDNIVNRSVNSYKVDITVDDVYGRDSITPDAFNGMMLYQKDNKMFQFFDGTAWRNVPRILGETILTAAADNIAIAGLPLRTRYKIEFGLIAVGQLNCGFRCNGDSAANYSNRYSQDAGAWTNAVSQANAYVMPIATSNSSGFIDLQTYSDVKHLMIESVVGNNNPATSPAWFDAYTKWCNVATLTDLNIFNVGTGDMGVGSLLRVWG